MSEERDDRKVRSIKNRALASDRLMRSEAVARRAGVSK